MEYSKESIFKAQVSATEPDITSREKTKGEALVEDRRGASPQNDSFASHK